MAKLARLAIKEAWSVREMEEHAGAGSPRRVDGKPRKRSTKRRDPVLRALEEDLRVVLATKAHVRLRRGGSGIIEVPFRNHEDFERVFKVITGREASEVVS